MAASSSKKEEIDVLYRSVVETTGKQTVGF
jgi:hypothetical protein